MKNEFAVRNQGFSSQTASDNTELFYEESPTGSGSREEVFVGGRWLYCPSSELMYPQTDFGGIYRGARATWHGSQCTVLSVYRIESIVRACVMLDERGAEWDRQGIPAAELKLIDDV